MRGASPTRLIRRPGAALFLSLLAAPALDGQETNPGTNPASPSTGKARAANVIVFLADDMGFADLGVQGCTDIPTPYIDSLARDGVRCTSAYASAPRCAPTRSGLLTGRYQQRFGCELSAEGGLPPGETTVAERLKRAGYATGLVGKWHQGKADKDHPNAHGFDEFFGFLAGSNAYLPHAPGTFVANVLRNREPVQEQEYLTDAFGREAVAFVERHAAQPFFLLLAFNAPHRPMESTEKYLARFKAIEDPSRRTYAAMVSAMDDAVGRVLARVRELGLDEETLVLFLNDNGGPRKPQWNGSSNGALRGNKSSTFEGGLRVPFLARWKGTLPAGRVYDGLVSSLDVCPTALACAGLALEPDWKLDGVDLVPYLAGKKDGAPHELLFWRFDFPWRVQPLWKWAVRQGDLKLVHSPDRLTVEDSAANALSTGLFDVVHDPGEEKDLRAAKPEAARALEERWKEWNASLPPTTPSRGESSEDSEDD